LIYNNDAVESEEDIHYAMLRPNKPSSVLLIFRPGSSPVYMKSANMMYKKVLYVERDPALTEIESHVNP